MIPIIQTTLSRNPSPLRPPVFAGTASYEPDPMSPLDRALHPVIHAGRVAVITGAASGIGRAAAEEFVKLGLKVAIADIDEAELARVGKDLVGIIAGGASGGGASAANAATAAANVLVVPTDVSKLDEVVRLRDRVYEAWGEVAVLMNNAGINTVGTSWDGLDNWKHVFDVNLFGVVNVQQTFVPSMLHQENQAMIINSGSKRGITNLPGNAAFNASKAAVKSLTEGLAYELRERPDTNVTAHLFMPGKTHTAATASSADGDGDTEMDSKPEGEWSATETVLYMLDAVREGVFYILVPDGDTRKEVDQLRIMWSAADVAEGRPALSRWHPNYKCLFEEYVRESLVQME